MKSFKRKLGDKQKGFTLVELLLVLAIAGLIAALVLPKLMGGGQSEKEKRVQDDILALFGGAIEWKSASPSFSGINCNTVANNYASVPFSGCSGTNPFNGNYTLSASGSNLILTATGLPTESCTKLARNYTTSGQTAACSGGTLSVTHSAI